MVSGSISCMPIRIVGSLVICTFAPKSASPSVRVGWFCCDPMLVSSMVMAGCVSECGICVDRVSPMFMTVFMHVSSVVESRRVAVSVGCVLFQMDCAAESSSVGCLLIISAYVSCAGTCGMHAKSRMCSGRSGCVNLSVGAELFIVFIAHNSQSFACVKRSFWCTVFVFVVDVAHTSHCVMFLRESPGYWSLIVSNVDGV